MELTVQVNRAELAGSREGGTYNLHCNIETASDAFVNSSTLELYGDELRPSSVSTIASTPPPEWPTFRYNFREQHRECVLLFTLDSLSNLNGNESPVEVARGLTLLSNIESHSNKLVILSSKISGLGIAKYEGKVLFDINCTYSAATAGTGAAVTLRDLVAMKTTQNNLPLLYSNQLMETHDSLDNYYDKANEESLSSTSTREESPLMRQLTASQLVVKEKQEAATMSGVYPTESPLVTVILHAINLPDMPSTKKLNLSSFSCLEEDDSEHQNDPSCEWFEGKFSQGSFAYNYVGSMKSACFRLEEHTRVGLYLFVEDMKSPLIRISESSVTLDPFCFHHRVWPHSVLTAVSSVDHYLQSSVHVLTSVHLTPSQSDFHSHEGLEVALGRIVNDKPVHKAVVLGAQIVSEGSEQPTPDPHHPSFIATKQQAANNYKMAILKSSVDSDVFLKSYFFFKIGSSLDLTRIESAQLSLNFKVYLIEPSSSLPWWMNPIAQSASLSLNKRLLSVLLNDTAKDGVLWRISVGDSDLELTFILRWKMKQMEFLTEPDESAIQQLHHLKDLLDPVIPVPACTSPQLVPTLPLTHQDQLQPEEEHRLTAEASQPLPEEPLHLIKATIEELPQDLNQLKLQNQQLEMKNQSLVQQLTITDSATSISESDANLRAQLASLSNPTLIDTVLKLRAKLVQETIQKESYQQKTHALQNILIQKNSSEQELISLQQAHTGQQRLVHELQRKIKKYRKCYEAWLQQDATIKRLEAALLDRKEPPIKQPETVLHETNTSEIESEEEEEEEEEDEEEDEDGSVVLELETKLANALNRITQLEGALNPYASAMYPVLNQMQGAGGPGLGVYQAMPQSLLDIETKLQKLKHENKQLRKQLTQQNH